MTLRFGSVFQKKYASAGIEIDQNDKVCGCLSLYARQLHVCTESRTSRFFDDYGMFLFCIACELLPASRAQVIDFDGPTGLLRRAVLFVGWLRVERLSFVGSLKNRFSSRTLVSGSYPSRGSAAGSPSPNWRS